jgi:ribonuclease Y
MSIQLTILLLTLAACAFTALGYILRVLVALGHRESIDMQVRQKLLDAKERANKIIEEAETRAERIERENSGPLREREARLGKREAFLDEREESLVDRTEVLEKREVDAARMRQEAEGLVRERRAELAKVANLTEEDARRRLIEDLEEMHHDALLARVQKLETTSKRQLDAKARELLITAIHRLGSSVNGEVMTMMVPLPSEELKGKIIGKEGRNIKAFERATGVDVIIDEAPDRITLSSFDPLRRYVAKVAIERLVEDGRIQPAKIEETVEKVRAEADTLVKEKGEEAAYEAGVVGLDPKLITLLGRLHFRSSYGQNVLQHSVEMSHIAGMLAYELGADPEIARAGALLHDIGKAVDHEVQGTHVEIGRRILEKFGVDKRVIQAMQSHHEEFAYETPEAKIVQVADAISGGRPGARRDTVERYLERLKDLERLAASFPGVEKAYAIQAGREIRIFVNPGKISDLATHRLAASIAGRIQEELKYPGEIKVNVIRENRVVEFAR